MKKSADTRVTVIKVNDESGMMKVKLDYISIQTMNPEKMINFYVTYFGAAVEGFRLPVNQPDHLGTRAPGYAGTAQKQTVYVLSFSGGFKIRLMAQEPSVSGRQPYPGASLSPMNLTFKLGSRRRVNQLTCRMIQEGHEVISEPGVCDPAHYSSSVLDPEGNIIELGA